MVTVTGIGNCYDLLPILIIKINYKLYLEIAEKKDDSVPTQIMYSLNSDFTALKGAHSVKTSIWFTF